MAKDNLFLGMARGKVGDVVFSRLNGVQVTRARNRSPKNPKSVPQLLQRVIMNTMGKAYSLLQPIANHAFEGYAEGTPCQSRFMQLNIAMLRDLASAVIQDPSEETIINSQASNFSAKDDSYAMANPYVISDGTLPATNVTMSVDEGILNFPFPQAGSGVENAFTYEDMVNAMGCQPGDQLTFLMMTHDFTQSGTSFVNGFVYARVILMPSDGGMAHGFSNDIDHPLYPNPRNEGSFNLFTLVKTGNLWTGLRFRVKPAELVDGARGACAAAVILSREGIGGRWLRSPSRFVINPELNTGWLGAAYASFLTEGAASGLYLNQAE